MFLYDFVKVVKLGCDGWVCCIWLCFLFFKWLYWVRLMWDLGIKGGILKV